MAHLPFVPCGGGFINGVWIFASFKNSGFSDVASGQMLVLVKSASRDDCVSVGQIPRTATDRLLYNEQSYISIVLGRMNKSPPRLRLCIGHHKSQGRRWRCSSPF